MGSWSLVVFEAGLGRLDCDRLDIEMVPAMGSTPRRRGEIGLRLYCQQGILMVSFMTNDAIVIIPDRTKLRKQRR